MSKVDAAKHEKHIEVPSLTLKGLMDNTHIDQIDFLKIDCENSEGSILQSTPDKYLKRVRKIAMEFHDQLSELNHSDIQNILERAGFTTKLKWDGKASVGFMYAWRH